MPQPYSLTPDSIFAGEFRVERLLAEGGMGAVYIVEQLGTGKRRALKVMHPMLAPDEKSRKRFVEEAKVGGRIDSAHVVEVVAAGVDDATDTPWLAMELLEGADLDRTVQERGPLPIDEVLDMLEQVAHALGDAHSKGIIHRDLKPENLFLAKSGRKGAPTLVKILDFGIARTVERSRTAATVTTAIGSPLWMAPEQAQPGAKLRPATDVWALGLIAFFLLTGRSYWKAANHAEFNLSALLVEVMTQTIESASVRAAALGVGVPFPAFFDAWFAGAVQRDPEARFADATVAIEALVEASSGHAVSNVGLAPTMALPESLPEPASRVAATAQLTSSPRSPGDVLPTQPLRTTRPTVPTPVARAGSAPPWKMIGGVAIGALIGTLMVAAATLLGGENTQRATTTVTRAETEAEEATPAPPPDTDPVAIVGPPAAEEGPAAEPESGEGGTETAGGAAEPPARAEPTSGPEPVSSPSPRRRASRRAARTPAAVREARPGGSASPNDTLDRALRPRPNSRPPTSGAAGAASPGTSDLPERPSRRDVSRALGPLMPRVRACAGTQVGMALCAIVVSNDGHVATVSVYGNPFGGTRQGACMEGVIRTARFPRFRNTSFRVTYPFNIR